MTRAVLGFVILAAAVLAASGARAQNCQLNGVNAVYISAGTSVSVASPYNPYSGSDTLHNFTVTVTNPSPSSDCTFALSFTRTVLPATMTSGASTLQYSIESSAGATLLQSTGFVQNSSPPQANRIDAFVGPSSSVNLSVRIRIAAGQTAATAGSYSDAAVIVGIYRLNVNNGNPRRIVDERAFFVSATVASTCLLPAPDVAVLDFSSAITQGIPNAAVVKRSTFSGVACTQPSKIRLTGSALQPTSAIGSAAGFNNFINWRAVGVFGSATVTHLTTSGASTTSSGFNVPSGAFSGATVTVDVNLLAGNPIIAGSYEGILTVSIDPNL